MLGTSGIKAQGEKTGLSNWRTLLRRREYQVPFVNDSEAYDKIGIFFKDRTRNSGAPIDEEIFHFCECSDCKEFK
jgi:hypothetical protein